MASINPLEMSFGHEPTWQGCIDKWGASRKQKNRRNWQGDENALRNLQALIPYSHRGPVYREWIIKENYPVCSPREIRGLVVDDIGTGENIIDHPDVISALDKLQEVAPNISLVNPNFNNLGPMFIAHGVADPSKINIEELVQNYMHSR